MLITSVYETNSALSQYLLFHYGEDHNLMPFSLVEKNALHFPVRCVTECVNKEILSKSAKGLDIGCAVGRTSFELSRYCKNVTAIDNSSLFISAAKTLQQVGCLEYTIQEEGGDESTHIAQLPDKVNAQSVNFICSDIMDVASSLEGFEVVIAANLLCRLHNPKKFLETLSKLVIPGGQLILTSPYSWQEEYTSLIHWLNRKDNKRALDSLQKILNKDFDLNRFFDMPFLIREHYRKYQLGVAQATVWERKK